MVNFTAIHYLTTGGRIMKKTPRAGSVPIKFSRSSNPNSNAATSIPPPIPPSPQSTNTVSPQAAEKHASTPPPVLPPKPKLPLKNHTSPRSSVAPAKKTSVLQGNISIPSEQEVKKPEPALKTESPFERIQREDKLLYHCIGSLGTKRAEFIAELDLLHAIFRDKHIAFLDNPTIQHLKSKLPILLRPCDILFEEKANLLAKEKLTEKDIASLIAIKEIVESILKELKDEKDKPGVIKTILSTMSLPRKSRRQLEKLLRVMSDLKIAYDKSINVLLKGTRDEREDLLTSKPHIKGPHLSYPIEISREVYCRINSVDNDGNHYKENTTGAHRVTNMTVPAPDHHNPQYLQRFLTSDKKIRMFFKSNEDPIDGNDDFICPQAERRNGFAIRVNGASAASSTWIVADEGTRFYDPDGQPELHSSDPADTVIPNYAKHFVKRNIVQVGLGAQGNPIEDTAMLICRNEMLIEKIGVEAFHHSLEIIMDIPRCFALRENDPWFQDLLKFKKNTELTPAELTEFSKTVVYALREVLKNISAENLPILVDGLKKLPQGKIILDQSIEDQACYLMKDWLTNAMPKAKANDLIRLIAQLAAAPQIIIGQSLGDLLSHTNQLPIFRYFFPKTPIAQLQEKLKNIEHLICPEDYDKWTDATDYGFNDCTGSNVFFEVAKRDPITEEALSVIQVGIDNSEGPQHEAYRIDKVLKRKNQATQAEEKFTETKFYIQYRSIVQTFPAKMAQVIPRDIIERKIAKDPYFVFAEFLKCVAQDHDDNLRCEEDGVITPSDYHFKYKRQNDMGDGFIVVEKTTIDIFAKFHNSIFTDIFRRSQKRHAFYKQGKELTYWDRFIKLFPLAGPVYKKLVEKYNLDITSVLGAIRRGSIDLIFAEPLEKVFDQKFVERLNGRTVDANDHERQRVLSFDQLNARIHKEISIEKWDSESILDFCDIVGTHFPEPDFLDPLSKETIEKMILEATRQARPAALALLLCKYQLIDEKNVGDLANRALSELIKNLPMSDDQTTILKSLKTADVILNFVLVAEHSPRHVKELLEGTRKAFHPILELSRINKPYKSITKNLLKKLIRAGFDIEARDEKGLSAVDYAVLNDSVPMFCTLVEGGPRRLSGIKGDLKASQNVSAWKFLNELRLVDFLEAHEEIPASIRKKIMRNSRVAGEMIKRKIFIDPKNPGQHKTLIPVKTLEGDKSLPIDFIGLFIDKLGFLLQAEASVKAERKDEKHGTRPVVGVEYEGLGCHVKIDPEFPVLEKLGEACVQEAIGFGTSHSDTIQFDATTFQALIDYYKTKPSSSKNTATIAGLERLKKGKPIRILVSNTVEGKNCQNAMKANAGNILAKEEKFNEEQLANYMLLTLMMIPSVFRDAKPDNIMIGDDLDLCLIDKGVNNLPPFKEDKLEFLCVLFNMDHMYANLLVKVLYDLLSIDVDTFLSKRFGEFSALCESHLSNFGQSPEIPSELDSSWVLQHRTRFKDMQTALRKALDRLLNDEEPMNSMEVLQRTLSKTWLAYRHGNRQDDTVAGRFFKSTQSVLSQLLNIYAGTKINTAAAMKTRFTKSVAAPMFGKKAQLVHYNPAQAYTDFSESIRKSINLDEIIAALKRGDTQSFINLRIKTPEGFLPLHDLRAAVINKIDYSTVDEATQRIIIDCLKSDEGFTDFKEELRLNGMTALEKDDLNVLLENCTDLRELYLRGCSGLNTDGSHFKVAGLKLKNRLTKSLLDIIKEKAPGLISLDLSGSSVEEVKFAGSDLEQLEYLYLEGCENLIRAHVESKALKHLSLENNPLLTRVHFDSEVLSVLNMKGCTNLPAEVLQQMLKQAAKLKRFTFEPGANFVPRTLSWFVFQAWQPDISRLSKDHRVNRHLLKAMIKDGVLQLGALPITETDLNDIREILSSPENKKDPINCHTLDLRGLETFHRDTIRKLTLDMMSGKNGLKEIKCQPRVRPKVDVKPRQWQVNDKRINEMLISPEGQVVISSQDGQIYFLDAEKIGIEENPCVKILKGHTETAWPIIFSSTGELISGGSKEIILWNLKTDKPQYKSKTASTYHISLYGNDNFTSSSSEFIIQVWNCSDLKLTKSHKGNTMRITGQIAVLPDLQVIYSTDATPGVFQLWNAGLINNTKDYASNSVDISSFSISHDDTLLVLSNKDVVEWNYKTWEKIATYPRDVNEGERTQRLPSNEYLINDLLSGNHAVLRVYSSDFKPVTILAELYDYITATQIGVDGNILYACNGCLYDQETQSLDVNLKQITTLLTNYHPLFIKNSIYFQTQNPELSQALIDILESLFEVNISVINTESQRGTVKVDFKDESALIDFYDYWHQLKGENSPEKPLNPHSQINIADLRLSSEDLMCLADCSPYLTRIQGLEEILILENYSNLFGRCSALKSIISNSNQSLSVDISFRELLPRSFHIDRKAEQLTITFSRPMNQFQTEAWESCMEFLKTIFPNQNSRSQKPSEAPPLLSHHYEQSEVIHFETPEQAEQCHTLLKALVSQRHEQNTHANSAEKQSPSYGLKRNSFHNEARRRYSSSDEDNTLHTPPELEESILN